VSAEQVVILAAGLGTRLARSLPKPLTVLADGRAIMQQQLDNIRVTLGDSARIVIVVGFKMDLIMERFPDVLYAYNQDYDQTNTSKSLLKALRLSHDDGVLWFNGDVVFDAGILDRVKPLMEEDQSFVCVNTAAVGDEEVKYTTDGDGFVRELSKTVVGGAGEAIGINFVSSRDKEVLIQHLEKCDDGDYFERGIETAIAQHRLRVRPVDISDLFAVEIDFEADLVRANARRQP